MILDKAKIAHEYFRDTMAFIRQNNIEHKFDEIIKESWEYADAMQAEADKRKPIPKLPALQQTFIDGVEQPRYAPYCDEWQPDWSQAPENMTHWGMELGSAYWLKEEGNGLFCKIGKASLFGYTGNQQGSLRKRP